MKPWEEFQKQESKPWEAFKPQYQIGEAGLGEAARQVGAEGNLLQKIAYGIGDRAQRAGQGLGLDWLAQKFGAEPGARDVMSQAAEGAGIPATASGIATDIAMLGAIPATGIRSATAGALPKVASKIGASRPLTILDTMLTSGGITAATTPGGLGERAMAGGASAGMSGAFPAVLGVGQGIRRMSTKAGRQLGKAETLRNELGQEASDALMPQLRGAYKNASLGVSPTAAMKTQNPTLKALELGSRVKRPDLFAGLDEANAAARWNVIETLASKNVKAPQIRDEATTPLRNLALSSASNKPMLVYGGRVSEMIDDLRTGASRPNKAVQQMADYVDDELRKGVTPEQMYSIRKTLTDSIPNGTELGNSIKMARAERVKLVQAIDDGLDEASDGAWSVYMKTYQELSKPVTSQKAAGKILEYFQKSVPEGMVPPGMGKSPAAASFTKLVNREGSKQFGSKTFERFLPEDRAVLNMISDDLYRQQGVMKAGGVIGTDTASKIAAANRGDAVSAGLLGMGIESISPVPGVGGLLSSGMKRGLEKKREEALASLLLDPDAMATYLEKARRAEKFMRAAAMPGRGTRGEF